MTKEDKQNQIILIYLDKIYSKGTKLILYIDGYYEGISGGDFDDRYAVEKIVQYIPEKYHNQIYVITTDDRIELAKKDYESYGFGGIHSSTDMANISVLMADKNSIHIVTGPIKDECFAQLVQTNVYTQGDQTGYNCVSSIQMAQNKFTGENSVSPQVRTIIKTNHFSDELAKWGSIIEISKNLFPAKPTLPFALQLLVTKNQTTYKNCLSIVLKKLKIKTTFDNISDAYEYLLSFDLGLHPLDDTGLKFKFSGHRERVIYDYVSQINFNTSDKEKLKQMYGDALMSLSIVILAGKLQEVKINKNEKHYLYSDEWFRSGKGLLSMSDVKIFDMNVETLDEVMVYDIPTALLGAFQLNTKQFVDKYQEKGYSANNPIPYDNMMDMMVEMIEETMDKV